VTVLPHRWLLRAPGNLRARLGALLKIRAPDLSNPSKPTEKELTSAKNWKDSDTAKQRSPGLCREKALAAVAQRGSISFRLELRSQSTHLALKIPDDPNKTVGFRLIGSQSARRRNPVECYCVKVCGC
jgi:hypothetical protein